MVWVALQEQLQAILQTSIELVKLSSEQWDRTISDKRITGKTRWSGRLGQTIYFYLETNNRQVLTFAVDKERLTASETRLVELLISTHKVHNEEERLTPYSDEEQSLTLIREWILRHFENGDQHAELSARLLTSLSLHDQKIPILLQGDYSDTRIVENHELKKLLDSFFDGETVLVPLHEKEWLILVSDTILSESIGSENLGDKKALQEALASICSGLHEMLTNEWIGECRLSAHYPIQPVKELFNAFVTLRQTMSLGKMFHIVSNIHLPWELQLEKLLDMLPPDEKTAFVGRVFKRDDYQLDSETLLTLEHFFALECNVSETAKKLYIHRNTLLYRLDKFKQETGQDVRYFNDAVLVKMAIQLYKVTKRS